jgi:selenide, water dikinase
MSISTEQFQLTKLSKSGGCAGKIGPGELSHILSHLSTVTDPNVLVGTSTSDDAAVYKISDDLALVCTSDFFSPMVDDAFLFGEIAAANALSDIYAMGATPLFALNLLAYPSLALPPVHLGEMLKGASTKVIEAGTSTIGGHTVENPEIKFGLAVVGTVHPSKIWRNSEAEAGDILILTKPIGSGIVADAIKKGECPTDAFTETAHTMSSLNKVASEAMIRSNIQVNACTDVTGFGLLGHLFEIAEGSGLEATLELSKIPTIEGVKELIKNGYVPSGTHKNLQYLRKNLESQSTISEEELLLLADAQTSGGLLFSIPKESLEAAKNALLASNVLCAVIGTMHEGTAGKITILDN